MAAFVAVADDASAVVWNPAGLVTGPTFNLLLDFAHNVHEPVTTPASGGEAANGSATLFALGTLPIGLTYYRLTATEAVSVADEPAGVGTPDRQDSQVLVRTLVTSHLGATIQQSLGSHFTLGTTVKLVRGEVGAVVRTASSWEEALETGDGFDRTASTQGDLDIGAMAYAGRFRLGVVVRNVTEPSFGPADDVETRTLARYARAGIAWGNRWTGISSTVVAFDADLTRVAAVGGERRDVAGGVEQWLARRRFGVRGGVAKKLALC